MSENKYFGAWVKKYIYCKIDLNGKNYYLNIEKTVNKKNDNSPDYRIKIENDVFGGWVKEGENGSRVYSKVKISGKEYHLNIFKNDKKEKDTHPDYNISLKEC